MENFEHFTATINGEDVDLRVYYTWDAELGKPEVVDAAINGKPVELTQPMADILHRELDEWLAYLTEFAEPWDIGIY